MTVSIVFRNTTGDFTGKGAKLTSLEADTNNYNFKTAVEALQTAVAANGGGIDHIDQTSSTTFTVTLTDSTILGPFTLPTATWISRGTWIAGESYAINDIVFEESTLGLYVVKVAHTAATSFDAAEVIGGLNVYSLAFSLVTANLGAATQTSELTDSTYTLTADDNLKYFRCTNTDTGGVISITIPANAEEAISINTEISFRQCSINNLAFEAASDVTLNVPYGHSADTDHVGAVVTLKKVDTDEWDIFGSLIAISA